MRRGIAYPLGAVGEALRGLAGWTGVIVATLVLGFWAGQCVGHAELQGLRATAEAFSWIFLVWVGQPAIFVAYAGTALAWYLPIHFHALWLRVIAATMNFLTWLIVVAYIVRLTSHNKFWRW